jgi:antitoxin PrlF
MTVVKVSDKGQVVIPARMRRSLGITPGSELEFSQEGPTLRVVVRHVRKVTRLEDGYGMLVYEGAPRRLAEFDAAKSLKEGRRK